MLKKFHQFINEQVTTLSPEQVDFLNKYTQGEWSINQQTRLVDIKGDFDASNRTLIDFKGIKFGVVTGDFNCYENELTSLKGSPHTVGGCFDCSNNKLTTLKGSPKNVDSHFACDCNNLTSLVGAPQTVGGNFYCYKNELTSLTGAPQTIVGNFNCSYNKLTSLTGAPQTVSKDFYCGHNKLTSLIGAPQTVSGDFSCSNNNLVSLQGIPITAKHKYIEFNALPTPVLLASLKSPQLFYKALAKAFNNNEIDYPRWPMLDLEWISIR